MTTPKGIQPFPVNTYHGFVRHDFQLGENPVTIIEPRNPLPGRRWVWKAEFFTAFPTFDLAMLERGWWLAYMNVGNTFGCPSAMDRFDAFHEEMTGKYGFHPRPVLEGLSRGGLYVYNWTARNPDKVACLYADNAVCDFKSWPGGKGIGPGSPDDWSKLLIDYGFSSEEEALAYAGNPVDNLEPLARAGVPVIHAAATEDEAVPISENTDVVEKRYRQLGGEIKVIRHPGGHHPHGLEDPTPIIEYVSSRMELT